jgi:hypothetical protein
VKPKPTNKRTNTILNKALAGNTNLAGAIFYALIWEKYGMGYNGNISKTHENAHTPILRSTDIQFIQSADKSQYRANVSESSRNMLGKNRNMGVHGNMLEKAHINMLEKFRNMEIQSNMLAKNRNIGHWWRFSGFFNMPNEPFSGRKVLRFYVRFLALFWSLLSCFFPAF